MSILKENLYSMIDALNDEQRSSVYDFAQYLIDRQIKDFRNEIDSKEPDNNPLTDEEKEQINDGDEFISMEEAKRELGL